MEFLYLSPDFPPNYALFPIQLNRMGIHVWGVGMADFFTMPEALRSAMRYYVQADLHCADAVTDAVRRLLDIKASQGSPPRFDLVESHNEIWLAREADINEMLDLDGIRPPDLPRLKRKSAMKTLFQEMGLPVARGARIRDLDHALELAGETGYPLILKPDEGVGAGGIVRVSHADQLKQALAGRNEDLVLEEFITGRIVSYDGLADWRGAPLFENSLCYGDGVLDYVQEGKDTFFYVNREIPEALSAIGRRLLTAFGVRRKFFHFEFFEVDGIYMPIEINCRPPGGPIIDMMNFSADADLYAAYARMIAGEPVALPETKKYYCAYVGRRDRAYRFSHETILDLWGGHIPDHGLNPVVFRQAMSDFRYIVRSPDLDDLLRISDAIRETR